MGSSATYVDFNNNISSVKPWCLTDIHTRFAVLLDKQSRNLGYSLFIFDPLSPGYPLITECFKDTTKDSSGLGHDQPPKVGTGPWWLTRRKEIMAITLPPLDSHTRTHRTTEKHLYTHTLPYTHIQSPRWLMTARVFLNLIYPTPPLCCCTRYQMMLQLKS